MVICNLISIELIPCWWIGLGQATFCHKMNYMKNNISFQKFGDFGNMNNGKGGYLLNSSGSVIV